MSRPLYGKHAQNMMKTDVREGEKSYELDIDLPGFSRMKSPSSWKTAT